jgi:hypothetical protein
MCSCYWNRFALLGGRPSPFQSTFSNSVSLRSVLLLSSQICLHFYRYHSSRVKFSIYFVSHCCLFYVAYVLFFVIWQHAEEDSLCNISQSPISPPLLCPTFSSPLCSQSPSMYVFPPGWETEFLTFAEHSKLGQAANILACVLRANSSGTPTALTQEFRGFLEPLKSAYYLFLVNVLYLSKTYLILYHISSKQSYGTDSCLLKVLLYVSRKVDCL